MDAPGKSPATQIEELQRAIAALDAQRAVLGGAVHKSALVSLRQALAELRSQDRSVGAVTIWLAGSHRQVNPSPNFLFVGSHRSA